MKIAKSIGLIYCRFVAKPSLFLEVFAGTGRSKQVKRVIMETAGNDRKMRMAKSIRLVHCRFVAKPPLFLEVFAGTGRSKQVTWAIMRTAGLTRMSKY